MDVTLSQDKTVALVSFAGNGKLDSTRTSPNIIPRGRMRASPLQQARGDLYPVTAVDPDFCSSLKSRAAYLAFVLFFAFVLLLISFRSLVIAIKAIVLNLISVAAGYGVLVLRLPKGLRKTSSP